MLPLLDEPFREIVPRYEKTDLSYCALLNLAVTKIALNKIVIMYRCSFFGHIFATQAAIFIA